MRTKKTFYLFNSADFKLKSAELKISLEDAVNKYCEYNFANESVIEMDVYMDYIIIYDDNYIFPNTYYNLKTGIYRLSGIWVNGNTGIIQEVNTKDYIKVLIDRGLAGKDMLQVRHITRKDYAK